MKSNASFQIPVPSSFFHQASTSRLQGLAFLFSIWALISAEYLLFGRRSVSVISPDHRDAEIALIITGPQPTSRTFPAGVFAISEKDLQIVGVIGGAI